MVAMEKITYQPLINHFKEQADQYNQLYHAHEIKYGAVDASIISSWMVKIIEPILRDVTVAAPDKLPGMCKALFTELLQLLGNQSGIIYENEYQAAWLLLKKTPSVVTVHPLRTLKAINSALESLRTYKPENIFYWISLMDASIVYCQNIEELLSLGRIYAWLCGMAHLRERAKVEFGLLREELKSAVRSNSALKIDFTSALNSEWMHSKQPLFVGEVGGFIGYGGNFTSPPLVAQIGNDIFATDLKNSCAFFADSFGKVLIADIPLAPEVIAKNSNVHEIVTFKSKYINLIPFDDVSSCVIKNSTLVLTRKSSHHLFVYGWSNE
jgi:hypothetical protein